MKFVKLENTGEHEDLKNLLVAALHEGVTRYPKMGHSAVLGIASIVIGRYVALLPSEFREEAREIVLANFEMAIKGIETEDHGVREH